MISCQAQIQRNQYRKFKKRINFGNCDEKGKVLMQKLRKLEIFYKKLKKFVMENQRKWLVTGQDMPYFNLNITIIRKQQNMGLLSDLGEILTPEETAQLQPQLRRVGIRQFLKIYKKYKYWQKSSEATIIKWGEQIEGHFLTFNDKGQLQLCLQPLSQQYEGIQFPLMLEYGRWMFEMTPSQPYSTQCDFKQIIGSIRHKYEFLHSRSRMAITIPSVPFLGVRVPQNDQKFENQITQSLYISDNHIADHIRFRTLTKNIRQRRGKKVEIKVPIYIDSATKMEEISQTQPDPNFIDMDAMAFGMGMSCLQCTFSTKNLDHARYLYDQMHVLSPLMLAITAATPFHKGKIANWDARWKLIEASVDCRNEHERNPDSEKYLPTSRYSQSNLYVWNGEFNRPEYNDLPLNLNQQTVEYIKQAAHELQLEIDDFLLHHIANIFKRDILIVHENFKTMTDEDSTLFEMLNGTNWNSVRLKIPIDDQIGWRVEFRTMQVQLTADQNSAFSLLIHFFTRALHTHTDINLYLPISLVKQNFEIAHRIDAVRKQKFFWRVNVFDNGEPIVKLLTLHQIFFGCEEYPDYPGLFNFVKKALEHECNCDCENFKKVILEIEEFIRKITLGQRLTLAQWMRQYVSKHPDYKHNSILPKNVMDDMLITLDKISKGVLEDSNFSPIFSF